MRKYAIPSILFLLLLAMAPALSSTASASTLQTGQPSIPAGLLSYYVSVSSDSDVNHCTEGTVNPFTITSTICNAPSGAATAGMVTTCSSSCQNGGFTTYSSGYYGYEAYTTAPSNPTVSPAYDYASNSQVFFYWIGLQSCVYSPCGTTYLLQGGEAWGESTTYTSSNPTLFVEYYDSSTSSGCHTFNSYCATLGSFSVSPNDGLYFSVIYFGSGSYWALYVQDTASNKYVSMDIGIGSGTYGYPSGPGSNTEYALATSEADGLGAATNLYPAGMNMYDVVGTTSSYNYYVGSQTPWNLPPTGTVPVTIPWSTGTCSWGSSTCGDQDIIVN